MQLSLAASPLFEMQGPGAFSPGAKRKGASGELDGHPASGSLDLPASPHTALSLSDVKTIRGYCCREGPAVARAHPRPGPRCIHLWTPDFSSFQEGKSAATQRFLLNDPCSPDQHISPSSSWPATSVCSRASKRCFADGQELCTQHEAPLQPELETKPKP